eukprot:TRINITY_DN1039_c0_g2_i1.p1 TRINITY_DN1039_c0_g2~~TRINITY_DN1039_c0_g2_i1.p1  ORF type:complete len:545 (+),score=178.26 TRINITY_DN1039_c0_g2_i1:101-1735(+)
MRASCRALHKAAVEPPVDTYDPEKVPLYVEGNIHRLRRYAIQEIRKRQYKNLMPKGTSMKFGEVFVAADKLLDAKSIRGARQIEKDYFTFDPRNRDNTAMKQQYTESEKFSYVLKKEKRFFKALLPLLSQAGYRSIRYKDVAYARIHGFHRYRFRVNWTWLAGALFDRNVPSLSQKHDEGAIFEGRVAIFARGESVVSTSGYFFSDKYEALTKRFTDSVYYHLTKRCPRVACLFYPDHEEWYNNYLEKKKSAFGSAQDTVRVDIDDQLEYTTTSVGKIFGVWTLREPTFKNVIVMFRRNRPAQAIDNDNLWRSGGSGFNMYNIEIRQYRDVPKTDIELLLPEKTIRQKPLDHAASMSLFGVLGWTLYKAALTSLSLTQMGMLGVASGYATRLLAKWRSNQLKYTHTIESLRARNQKTTGTGTLRQLEHEAMVQMQKQAMIVYLVLLKEHERGGATHWWDSAALDAAVTNELANAMRQGVYDGYFQPEHAIRLVPGELALKVTNDNDIGGLGLWTHKVEGATLGLRAVKPDDALAVLQQQWFDLI